MNPWFGPEVAWLPGTALGVLCGFLGGLVGAVFPSEGRRKRWGAALAAVVYALLGASAALLLAGAAGLIAGQPRAVWYACLVPGIVCTAGLVFMRTMMWRFSQRATA